ncbi:hypothetical protein CRUP_022040 [Coryphaenoides rupestris]|nr:hypothetical protein CRUP_022040 [Coryphaenoides rupestris]
MCRGEEAAATPETHLAAAEEFTGDGSAGAPGQDEQLPLPLPHNTHTLRLQSNLLAGLPSEELHSLPNLTELDLSQNRFSSVPAWSRHAALDSLLSLHLEENQLAHLPRASFSSFPVLQELFLSHNRLHSLAAGAFAGLDSLLRLHMNNNRLTTIDPQWFKALPHLEVLILGGNPVEVLPEQGFQALRSLRSLMLGGMGLRVLSERALDGLDGLECLSFYDNQLTKVPTQALRRVPGLKFLDLNKNRIRLVETGGFRDMVHLKELGLNNMEDLVSIERAALENLPELTKLEITNNPRLSYIHPQAFLHLSRLESLMLNSNSLSALHHHTLLSLPSLQEVSLHSNPLRCDCLFRWAAVEGFHQHAREPHPQAPAADTQAGAVQMPTTRTVRFIQPQATLCSEPPELRARRVKEVSSREMSASCLPLIPAGPLPAYVGVREGANLALHCRALAEPLPVLYWVTPSGVRLGSAASHPPSQGPTTAQTSNHSLSPQRPQAHAEHNHSSHYRLHPQGTLEITGVTPKDAGMFTCVAENALGADTRSVTVVVHCSKNKRQRRKPMSANLRRYPHEAAEADLKVREVGQHYMVLSWTNGHNLPMTRLFWRAINPDAAHTATYTTRILAGTQSFNLTHLAPETFYRVCLHLGLSQAGEQHEGRSGKESSRTQCVTVKTKEAPPSKQLLAISPELGSTGLVLLFLVVLLLILASQRLDRRSADRPEQCHVDLLQEVTDQGLANGTPENGTDQGAQEEKAPFHHYC